ncbi:unnamed protein product [Somion occarium]|uniref:Uncharacterized protein n=1 Tax=Somion occarium TaxID=3059160 RepID=A0ABP1DEN1_9APHY
MEGLTIAEARLWGTVVEGILYGLYIACFTACLSLFFSRLVRRTKQNKIILWTITVLFCLTTAHFGCTMQALRMGFFETRLPATPDAYFNDRALPLNLVIKSINGVTMVLGDCLMLFRLWVIYEGNIFVMALPTLTMLATGAIVFVLTWEFSNLTPTQNSFAESIKRIAPAAFVLPVVTNVFITALILYRIISTRAAVRRFTSIHDDHIYRTVITNVVESCLIYPVVLIVALILYLCNSNGQDITGALPQVIGIVATLLWVLVHLGFSRYDVARNQCISEESIEARMTFVIPKPPTPDIP